MTSIPPPKPTIKAGPQPSELHVLAIINSTSTGQSWLTAWKPRLAEYTVTLVCEDGVVFPEALVSAPNFSTTTRSALTKDLGAAASSLSLRDLAILAARKPYVLLLDDSCVPATKPGSSDPIDAPAQHLTNLATPATPFFFNTLYDPYAPGTDFVRGYPFSLREGTPTAVSHGLWLNVPDYDAATQMAKSQERNTRYVDAVLTVPRGSFFNISFRNLGLNVPLIGVAAYGGIDQDGKPSSDPTWASYTLKAVSDHLGYGCKTGTPYVSCERPSVTAANADMEKEYKGVKFQKEVLSFFTSLQLSKESTTPEAAYTELAQKVKAQLGPLDPYFGKLADSMQAWAAAYKAAVQVK